MNKFRFYIFAYVLFCNQIIIFRKRILIEFCDNIFQFLIGTAQ